MLLQSMDTETTEMVDTIAFYKGRLTAAPSGHAVWHFRNPRIGCKLLAWHLKDPQDLIPTGKARGGSASRL